MYYKNKRGFTLIELLVVVLIIGILAAIAVPQYQKAVMKSRSINMLMLLRSIASAEETYYLTNGNWATKFDQLDIIIPGEKTGSFLLNTYTDTLSQDGWVLQNEVYSTYRNTFLVHTQGPYRGGGFVHAKALPFRTFSTPAILCFERKAAASHTLTQKGKFCEKLMKGVFLDEDPWTRYFALP